MDSHSFHSNVVPTNLVGWLLNTWMFSIVNQIMLPSIFLFPLRHICGQYRAYRLFSHTEPEILFRQYFWSHISVILMHGTLSSTSMLYGKVSNKSLLYNLQWRKEGPRACWPVSAPPSVFQSGINNMGGFAWAHSVTSCENRLPFFSHTAAACGETVKTRHKFVTEPLLNDKKHSVMRGPLLVANLTLTDAGDRTPSPAPRYAIENLGTWPESTPKFWLRTSDALYEFPTSNQLSTYCSFWSRRVR